MWLNPTARCAASPLHYWQVHPYFCFYLCCREEGGCLHKMWMQSTAKHLETESLAALCRIRPNSNMKSVQDQDEVGALSDSWERSLCTCQTTSPKQFLDLLSLDVERPLRSGSLVLGFLFFFERKKGRQALNFLQFVQLEMLEPKAMTLTALLQSQDK